MICFDRIPMTHHVECVAIRAADVESAELLPLANAIASAAESRRTSANACASTQATLPRALWKRRPR
ncbi:hypothetical protein SLUN_04855 [Streptomyces lunaelactis]|uniref:Uncharacterized protein n=1 Tax=Streptomyces lunaelactis TaxID=1535768 RepID=A0A2R4SXK5_9ACTN|nr:hypothetical protein SLUN_04855 [Streptomyces lunaelactis]